MDFKIILTQAALDDLEEIVEYIGQDDPRAADRVASGLLIEAESLSQMPRRGKAMRARPGVRRLIRNPYLIVHRIDETAQAVKILRFWHGARNPRSFPTE